MGCDGGSIPKRDDLVKTKKVSHPSSKTCISDRWTKCALGGEPLKAPIVVCKKGKLYNKEAVLKYLLGLREGQPPLSHLLHINSLKDVKTLKTTANKGTIAESASLKAGEQADEGSSAFICPVTGREMNGNFKFIYLKKCGCVFAECALAKFDTDVCLKCSERRTKNDIVCIDPSSPVNENNTEDTRDKIERPLKRVGPEEGKETSPRKRQIDENDKARDVPYFPAPPATRAKSSFSGMATFRKTSAISSLYSSDSSRAFH